MGLSFLAQSCEQLLHLLITWQNAGFKRALSDEQRLEGEPRSTLGRPHGISGQSVSASTKPKQDEGVLTRRCIDLSECVLDSARRVLDRHMAQQRNREHRYIWMKMKIRQFVGRGSLACRALRAWQRTAAHQAESAWLTRGSLLQAVTRERRRVASKRRSRLALQWWHQYAENRRQWRLHSLHTARALRLTRKNYTRVRRCLGEWALRAGYWVAKRRLLRVSGRLGAQRTRGRALQLWADVVCERRAARAFRQTLDEDIWKQRTFEFAQQELAESRVRQGVLQQGLDARQLRPPSPTARQVYADSLGRHAFTQEVTTLHEAFQELAGGHTAGQQARASSGRRGAAAARAGGGRGQERSWRWRRNVLHASWEAREVAWLGWRRMRMQQERLLMAVALEGFRLHMLWRAVKEERLRSGAAAAHAASALARRHAPRLLRRSARAAEVRRRCLSVCTYGDIEYVYTCMDTGGSRTVARELLVAGRAATASLVCRSCPLAAASGVCAACARSEAAASVVAGEGAVGTVECGRGHGSRGSSAAGGGEITGGVSRGAG